MISLVIIAAILFCTYLVIMRTMYGIPSMISDTFYQLEERGYLFTVLIILISIMMLVSILDVSKGIQAFAFIGCTGLSFVGLAPNYKAQEDYKVHKGGAIISAIGCILWCVSAYPLPTLWITFAYSQYYIWFTSIGKIGHPWYWAEVACFIDVFITYFCISS